MVCAVVDAVNNMEVRLVAMRLLLFRHGFDALEAGVVLLQLMLAVVIQALLLKVDLDVHGPVAHLDFLSLFLPPKTAFSKYSSAQKAVRGRESFNFEQVRIRKKRNCGILLMFDLKYMVKKKRKEEKLAFLE